MRHLRTLVAAGCLAALSMTAQSGGAQLWTATPDATLASMRGGFATPSGLMVSFGIVRTVQIDGLVVSHTSLQIHDMQNITPQQARDLAQATSLAIVQNGAGNKANGLASLAVPGVVIQNTESNRNIQSVTVIDAATNSLGMLQGLNFNQTLNDALRGALGH